MMPVTAYNITYSLSQALGVFAVYKLMRAFFEKRNFRKIVEVIFFIVFYIIAVSVYLLINIPLVNFAVTLLSYFLLTFLYSSSVKKKIFVSLVVFVFGICTEMLVVTLTGYIDFPISEANNYDSVFGIVTLNVLFFIVSMVANGFKNIKNDNVIPKSFWAALLIVPISSLFVLAMFFQSKELSVYEVSSSVAVILIMNFTVFFLFDRIAKLYMEKQENAFIKRQNEYYVNQLMVTEDSYETSKKLRHNIKNHLVAILSYIENNNNDEAKKYISDIIGFYQGKAEIVHTGYPEIDGLLNYKLQPALEDGTKVNVKVSLPSDLFFSSFDLTVILGNLIDNALEAIAFVDENRFINFKMGCSKGMMVIKISNSYKNAVKMENEKIITSKKDKVNHGLGLRSVNEVLERYNGMTKIETDENAFTITAVLYLKQN